MWARLDCGVTRAGYLGQPPALGVLGHRYRLKVIRVDAPRIAAQVVKDEIVWDLTD